ncbi:MAG: CopG family transcriptional regulator [Chloroflexota bacterium]|nr:CopG family transcriptional regulator [Chloroflexota bacterium]
MKVLTKKPIQIYLKPTQDRALRALAQREGVPIAELVRRSIDHYLAELPVEEDPALQVVGLGRSGRKDLASKHDDYLAALAKEENS